MVSLPGCQNADLGLPTDSEPSVPPGAAGRCEGGSVGAQPQTLDRKFYERPAELVAGSLVGKILSHGPLSGRIVEVEAYDESEPASHGFSGPRKSNATLFGPPGYLEVYLSYGVNYLTNVVCQPVGVGSGVLIRALEPMTGVDVMRANRGHPEVPDHRLCSGPGRLSKAFGLSRADNNTDLVVGSVRILDDRRSLPYARSTRIGVSAGQDLNWRFYVEKNASVSGPRALNERIGAATSSAVSEIRSSHQRIQTLSEAEHEFRSVEVPIG
jgi:DNA-3-methyladenine glycosylase